MRASIPSQSGLTKKEIIETNSLICIIFLFQYGLVLPFSFFINYQILIITLTLSLFLFCVLKKSIRINIRTIWLFAIPLLLLILKMPFEYHTISSDGNIALEYLIKFLTIGVSGILIGTIKFDYHVFIKYGYIIAWVNFILICWIPFLNINDSHSDPSSYMRFGYAILPSVALSFTYLFCEKKTFSALLLLILSCIEMFIYGARGAFLTFLVFVILFLLTSPEIKSAKRISFIIFITISGFIFISYLPSIISILNSYGIKTYSLIKYSNYLNGDNLATVSSGRDALYISAIKRIINSPILGSPFNTCYVDFHNFGLSYYHNILLDLAVNFGIPLTIIFIAIFLYRGNQILTTKDKITITVFLVLLCLPMGRLFISSNFWSRPDFWLLISFMAHYK